MSLHRRHALSLIASVAAPTPALARRPVRPVRFLHGVASGDPFSDSVLLWTRLSPEQPGAGPLEAQWELAEDADFARIVARGVALTGPDKDYTVKAVASGLQPGRDYYYRFRSGGVVSPLGRTRTLPAGPTERVELAFVTCSLYPNGYFNAYHHISRLERVDAVVHLGDYIYEYGGAPDDYGMDNGLRLGRIPEPAHEIVTLADYRTRHGLYKRDPDLQAAHARAPWIVVWDDHETANDSWVGGAENHHPDRQGPWLDRERAAIRAYYEWMPIREPEPGRAFEAINRSFQFGDLATLVMLETRLLARSYQLEYDRPGDVPLALYSSDDPARRRRVTDPAIVRKAMEAAAAGREPPAPYRLGPDPEALRAILASPERRMLGERQEQWLAAELARSVQAGATWQLLGNQVVIARTPAPDLIKAAGPASFRRMLAAMPADKRADAGKLAWLFSFPVPFDLDGWDGYPAARERLYDALKSAGGNPVVLSGDSHAFWANALHDAQGAYVAAEFGTSAVSSPCPGEGVPGVDLGAVFVAQAPEVKFNDQLAKGYIRLSLSRQEAVAELVAVETLVKPYAARTLARFRVRPAPGSAPGPIERI